LDFCLYIWGFLFPGLASLEKDLWVSAYISSSASKKAQYGELLNKYVEQAQKLPEDELMFIFLFPPRANLKVDKLLNEAYFTTAEKIKEILGRRAIVFSGNFDSLNPKTDFQKLKDMAASRGYYFDQAVALDAYGERLKKCVRKGAKNIGAGLGLKNSSDLRPELSDEAII